jgi:hypothetical protein
MTTHDLTDDAVELLVKAARGVLHGQELVDWATKTLATGYDSPALVILAGADLDSVPIVSETLPLFVRALTELGVAVPADEDGLLRARAKTIARHILNGDVTPSQGVAMMEKEVVSPLGHPRDLMAWCYLSSDLHPETFDDLNEQELTDLVLRLARTTAECGVL